MEVILLDEIENFGQLGDKVKVKRGFARNFLLPKGKAVLATKKNMAYFDERRSELESKAAKAIEEAKSRACAINELASLTIASKAGSEGRLFGSIGTRDIAKSLSDAGIPVMKNEVRLLNGFLRTLGEHEVHFKIYNGVFAQLKVIIISED